MKESTLDNLAIGDHVIFVDEHSNVKDALVIHIFWAQDHTHPESVDGYPTINLITVDGNEDKDDSYGRQIIRPTSIAHKTRTSAPGYYWMRPEDV